MVVCMGQRNGTIPCKQALISSGTVHGNRKNPHQQKKHMHLMRPHGVVTPATSSLRPVRPVRPEFSSSVRTLPEHPESVPNARRPLLRPELRSNTPLHSDLTSPPFSISQRPDAFNSPAPSRSRQDNHTPTPSLLA